MKTINDTKNDLNRDMDNNEMDSEDTNHSNKGPDAFLKFFSTTANGHVKNRKLGGRKEISLVKFRTKNIDCRQNLVLSLKKSEIVLIIVRITLLHMPIPWRPMKMKVK